eukprot:GHVL01038351.1.p1 GENE.GHVL01038351.1~~GHVL01038351.1.p1  ORF type:complete len:196 (-),score=10.20 GHVL01038351.1:131-718(-)
MSLSLYLVLSLFLSLSPPSLSFSLSISLSLSLSLSLIPISLCLSPPSKCSVFSFFRLFINCCPCLSYSFLLSPPSLFFPLFAFSPPPSSSIPPSPFSLSSLSPVLLSSCFQSAFRFLNLPHFFLCHTTDSYTPSLIFNLAVAISSWLMSSFRYTFSPTISKLSYLALTVCSLHLTSVSHMLRLFEQLHNMIGNEI